VVSTCSHDGDDSLTVDAALAPTPAQSRRDLVASVRDAALTCLRVRTKVIVVRLCSLLDPGRQRK
jgi:hypothetical protein